LPTPASKRQQGTAATADQLLNAARDVFESRGYTSTTVGAITSAANTAHGTFYLYFKNKEDAFGKVMASVTITDLWYHAVYTREEGDGGMPNRDRG
jgi:AcrR family transcriptional regulator